MRIFEHSMHGVLRLFVAVAVCVPFAGKAAVDFAKDVQPILQKNCYECHGPSKQEAGLRWDARQMGLARLTLGKPAESVLVQAIKGEGDLVMPPKGKRLSPAEIKVIEDWIASGANWPAEASVVIKDISDHWAFKPVSRPEVPEIKNRWVENEIDAFIYEKAREHNLKPSRSADKNTLIRRLSLDLTGLPPTIEEVDNFIKDRSRESYSRLVERLLASPHYGERWGRHWLDAARYADSNGYEKDVRRNIWPYRDWVIKAFNADMPYDKFVVDQLAGDLVPGSTLDQKVATGFLRNSMLNEEGGVDPEQFRFESIVDRMDAIGKSFLGLTIACAQCHSHKYDPISHKEYYQLFAFINNDDEPEIEVPTDEQIAKRKELLAKVKEIEDALIEKDTQLLQRMAKWEENLEKPGEWIVLDPEKWFGAIGVKFEKFNDGSLLALAHNPGESAYSLTYKTDLTNITAFRLEALTDPNLPRNGPGRAKNGNFVVQEVSLETSPVNSPEKTNIVKFAAASADFSQTGFPVEHAIDGIKTNGWAVDEGAALVNQNRKAVFATAEPVGEEGGTLLHFNLWQKHGSQHTLGRFRISAFVGENPPKADPVPHQVREILKISREERTGEQKRQIFSYYRTVDESCKEANAQIAKILADWPVGPTTLALRLRTNNPRTTYVHRRGEFNRPGSTPMEPGTPVVLHPMKPDAPKNRLGLARWMVDRENPLIARVMVNRIWQSYFGKGLVVTPEDFGTRADAPTHPELLDWLASEFMDSGWSIKHIHRLIVNSATYQQSPRVQPEALENDADNKWLARFPRLRVEAEIIRDISLSVSGLLSKKIGGPSVFPPIPEGVMSLAYGSKTWEVSKGEDKYRRGLYTFWKRTVPYPALVVFDAPTAEASCVRRVNSNTPLQALTTLNDATFHEASQAMALRVWKEGGKNSRDRAVFAFKLCTGREPRRSELGQILDLLHEHSDYFENRTTDAVTVAATDPKEPPSGVNLHKVAAWTTVCRVLLNLDETVTRE